MATAKTKAKTAAKTKAKRATAPAAPARNLQVAMDLNALRRTDPMAWREKLFAAFRETGGNAVRAAAWLGIGHRSIVRFMVEDPVLSAGVEKIRAAAKSERKAAGEKAEA